MKRDASKRGFRGVVAASVLMGALILPAGLAHATGIEKIGPWSVVTYDKADGARDVAAIVSDSGSKLGLAIRCVDASLSIALVPLSDDLLFGTARRASLLSVQPDAGPAAEMEGVVGEDHAVHLQSPAPLLTLVLGAKRLSVSAPAANGNDVSGRFDLTEGRRTLIDLARRCPGG
jgi:hypothetical protein